MSCNEDFKTAKTDGVGQLWKDPDLAAKLKNFPFTIFQYGADESIAREWVEKTFEGKVPIVNSLEEKIDHSQDPLIVSSKIFEQHEILDFEDIYKFVSQHGYVFKKKDGTTTTIEKGRRIIILNFGPHKELDYEDFILELHPHWGGNVMILDIPVYSTREAYDTV